MIMSADRMHAHHNGSSDTDSMISPKSDAMSGSRFSLRYNSADNQYSKGVGMTSAEDGNHQFELVESDELGGLADDEKHSILGQLNQQSSHSTSFGCHWWLNCVHITKSELLTLQKMFHLHSLTTEDIFSLESHEKVDQYPHYTFVSFHGVTIQESDYQNQYCGASETHSVSPSMWEHNISYYTQKVDRFEMYMILLENGIITFTFDKLTPQQTIPSQSQLISHSVMNKLVQIWHYQFPDYPFEIRCEWIMYGIIDEVIDSLTGIIEQIEVEIDFIEDSVFQVKVVEFSRMLALIGSLRKKIVQIMRLTVNKRQVLKRIITGTHLLERNSQLQLYYSDINDHLLNIVDKLILYEKLLGKSHSNYLAQLQVKSFDSNLTITKLFSKMTVLGTIFIPLMIVSSLFGMNVEVPGQDVDGLGWFFGIVGFMFAIVLALMLLMRKWLS